jgi:hypothetical protein
MFSIHSSRGESHRADGSTNYKTITRRVKDNGYDYVETSYIYW